MKLKMTSNINKLLLLITCCSFLLLQEVGGARPDLLADESVGYERQTSAKIRQLPLKVQVSAMALASSGPQTSLAMDDVSTGVVDSSGSSNDNRAPIRSPADKIRKPAKSLLYTTTVRPEESLVDDGFEMAAQERERERDRERDRLDRDRPKASTRSPKLKKPSKRLPVQVSQSHVDREDEDDDDCDDYTYRRLFHDMSDNPIRHFRGMMNNMFDQIQAAGSGFGNSFGNRHDDDDDGGSSSSNRSPASRRGLSSSSSSSSASAFSSGGDDDGYSRVSGLVNRNGRTRGIVSETRNGRTTFRRIGNDEEEDDYARSARSYDETDDN